MNENPTEGILGESTGWPGDRTELSQRTDLGLYAKDYLENLH